jgi:photosystem II stability/assembly factor-like uncharacterized protein
VQAAAAAAYFRSPLNETMTRILTTAISSVFLLALPAFGQWNIINHPGYQAVKSVTSGAGALYMVPYPSGVVKSTDGGNIWNPVNTGLPAGTTVHSVHFVNGALLCGTESGVYRSTNGGTSWAISNTGLPSANAGNYAKKFFQFGTTTLAIYSATIGGGGGIFRSTDGGVQWFGGNNGLAANMVVNQAAQAGSLIYAATTAGLASSNNLAVTWNQIATANFACYGVQGTASRLVVVSALGYRYSTTGGSTWTNSTGAPGAPSGGELILYDGKYWAINTASPMDVLRSTDNGASFSVYETGLQGADVISQNTFHASGNSLYLGCFSNLYSHAGTTLGLDDAHRSALPVPYPSLFTDGFSIDLSAEHAGSALVLFDANGREALRRSMSSAGINWIERGDIRAGTYHAALADRNTGELRPLGKLVAQ